VVVPDPESYNRVLARDIEPSRVELNGPPVDLAAVYQGLYEEIALPRPPRPPQLSRRQRSADDAVSTRRSRGWLSVAAVAIAAAAIVLLMPIRGAPGHQLALSLARQPEPLALPTHVKAGRRMTFSFAVSNQGDITVTYRYAVTESGPGGTVLLLGVLARREISRDGAEPVATRRARLRECQRTQFVDPGVVDPGAQRREPDRPDDRCHFRGGRFS
jgi:hypothetical protein